MVKKGKSNEIINLPPLISPTEEVAVEEHHPRYLEEYLYEVAIFTPHDAMANSNDLTCVAIFGGYQQLAYIRPYKDMTWTFVIGMEWILFSEVVYQNNQFYALTYKGALACFSVTNPNLKLVAKEIPVDNKDNCCYYKNYLVEYGGELLQIRRYIVRPKCILDPKTTMFKVFKWYFDGWLEMESLGDVALFLGDNSSGFPRQMTKF
ncbi:hypothetical protein TorRG33x02_350120 [Trema orientale]|uniref:KIB1-4 beta-propeller domain-containing protein n=1 Tax=Trema orientale TaxID=63057 RepID=A0A2P5AHR6_TREOI|nr:hypothetical protein TorRG33x02_350120 [Trema orientale]